MARSMSAGLLLLLGLLVFSGCGGNAVPDANALQDVTVQVSLPSGVSMGAATLSTPYGSSTLSGISGKATLTGDGVTLASISNTSGTLLMGFVSSTRTTLSFRTTAEAFAFYALQGQFLEPAMQTSLIDFLSKSDVLKPVENAVKGAFFTNPSQISLDNPTIKAALAAMLTVLAPLRAGGANGIGPLNVTVSPDYQASGLLVRETAPLNDAINVYNAFRRPVQVYVDRTSPSPGTVVNFPLEGAAIEQPSTAQTFQALTGFAQGDVPRSAIKSQDVAVPGGDNNQTAIYTVTVIGVGGNTLSSSVSSDKAQMAKDLAMKTAIERFLAPTINSALEAGAKQRTAADLSPILQGLSSNAVSEIQTGDFAQGINDAFADLFNSKALPTTVDRVLAVYYPGIRSRDSLQNMRERLTRSLSSLLGATASSVSTYGSGIIGTIKQSKRIETFTVVTKPITLRLTPEQSTIGKGGEVNLTAAIRLPQSMDPKSVTYRYSLTGIGAGYATDSGTDKAFPFTTNSTSITYKHRDTINIAYGTDTLTVEALQNQNGNQTTIAKASASVTVKENTIQLSPKTVDLSLGDQQTFTATVNPAPTASTLSYIFVTFGKSAFAGGAQTSVGSSNTVVFRQADDQEGDTQPVSVTVVLTDPTTNVQTILGQAEAVVNVKKQPSLQNGDFSQNLKFWTLGGVGATVGSGSRCLTAQNGNPYIYMDVYSGRVGSFNQTFKVPASAKTLSFRTWGNLDPVTVMVTLGGTALDTFIPPPLETLSDPKNPYSAVCNGAGYATKSYEISGFAGKTVTLTVSGSAPGNNGTFANFDDFQVK
ncbi:MAG: hypothetical protein IVW51_04130 [Thermaceae bacterium]|nr:hypothetical protein [Thermaceae bacterium]